MARSNTSNARAKEEEEGKQAREREREGEGGGGRTIRGFELHAFDVNAADGALTRRGVKAYAFFTRVISTRTRRQFLRG